MDKPEKRFGVYHWDTFEPPGNDTFLLSSFDTEEEAEAYVLKEYDGRLRNDGADRVQVVDWPMESQQGRVIRTWKTG